MQKVVASLPQSDPEAGPRVPKPPIRPPFRSVVFIARPRDILTLKTPGRPAVRNRFGVAFFIVLKKAA